MKQALYKGLPRKAYEDIDAVNFSKLKLFTLTAAHAREAMLHPKASTSKMEIGTATHMAILEPERFTAEYTRAPSFDRRTKEGKAAWTAFEAENTGRSYLDPDEWGQCIGMKQAVHGHELTRQLLHGPGANEATIVWTDAETGLLCKGRIDRVTSFLDWTMVLDFKSTLSADEGRFARQVVSFGYHVQAAFYLDGLNSIAPLERRFLLIAVERDAPHALQVFELDDAALDEGRALYRSYLRRYKTAKDSNTWPAYPVGIQPLSLPAWALKGGPQDE